MGREVSEKAQVLAVQMQLPAMGSQKGVEQLEGTVRREGALGRWDERKRKRKNAQRKRAFWPSGTFCGGLALPVVGTTSGQPYCIEKERKTEGL
jgi:hypothetical protein